MEFRFFPAGMSLVHGNGAVDHSEKPDVLLPRPFAAIPPGVKKPAGKFCGGQRVHLFLGADVYEQGTISRAPPPAEWHTC